MADAGHHLGEIPPHQIKKFPYRLLKERSLLADAEHYLEQYA